MTLHINKKEVTIDQIADDWDDAWIHTEKLFFDSATNVAIVEVEFIDSNFVRNFRKSGIAFSYETPVFQDTLEFQNVATLNTDFDHQEATLWLNNVEVTKNSVAFLCTQGNIEVVGVDRTCFLSRALLGENMQIRGTTFGSRSMRREQRGHASQTKVSGTESNKSRTRKQNKGVNKTKVSGTDI